jgi:uridine phosphorylase
MLRDLKKTDWLNILGIPPESIPRALILRGTRNLKHHYDGYRRWLHDAVEVGSPNGLFEDVMIGEFAGAQVAFASVYGAAMASEVTHVFGVLGTKLVLQTGCCGVWKSGVEPGDLVIPSHGGCGEGAAQYYVGRKLVVTPSVNSETFAGVRRASNVPVHFARIFTTGALLAEGRDEIEQWVADGWDGVDLETATTLAVAEHFGMDSAAILYAYDNPREHSDIVHTGAQKDERRRLGNSSMIEATFQVVRDYLELDRAEQRDRGVGPNTA